jgi:PAS domain S-box-containing protein
MIDQKSGKKEASHRLAEINRAITTSLNFDEVLDLIAENATQLVEARLCVLLLADNDGTLRVRAARGADSDLTRNFSGRMEEGVIQQLRTMLVIRKAETMVSLPVMAQQSLIGMLVLARAQPLNAEEQWQLSALTDQAAIALRNARLYAMEAAEGARARDVSQIALLRLAAIVESSDDAIASKDLNGIINSWNKGAERILGYTAAEIIGKPVTILIPADRLQEETEILDRIRRGQRIEHFETVRRRKDGSLINVSLAVSPIKNEDGEVIGASKIARDITDRKHAEEEIRFQAHLLNAVKQAVIATNLEGKIIFWNSYAETLYGWPAAEALGANILDVTPAPQLREAASEILSRLQAGKSWEGEFEVQRRDGTFFPALINDSPIFDATGKLIGIVGVSTDNTLRRQAEEERETLLRREREARGQAEEANRLKDEFLATLSHELRNPLNVVIGYSEILRRSDETQKHSFVVKAADTIRRNALAQSRLVSDLLDLSRLQMCKLSLDRQPVSLSTVITEAVETVSAQIETKNITLSIDLDPEILVVEGDSVRLGQIAWNLLNNAVKFTPVDGKISVKLDQEGAEAKLTVTDSGQGIAPAFLPHVFEIFRQADAGSSRRQGGMGIGLALVKQLTELHGGRVQAESEGIDRGTRFTIWIPLYVAGVEGLKEEGVSTTGALSNKFILVVDDSVESTDMLGKLLEMEGAFVDLARSAAEALALVDQKRFDLIISDISMPVMDGYQLLRELRKLPHMENVPAVALTGYGRQADVERARAEGFAHHLTKPLDIDQLLLIVRELTTENGGTRKEKLNLKPF